MAAHRSADPIAALREENEILREQVRQHQEALAPTALLPRAWRLTKTEERFLRAIRAVGPNLLHHERAMLTLYGMWEDMPEQKILDVMLCKIRRKLMHAQAQIRIETVWGRGWRMPPEACAAFDAAVAADLARWDQQRSAA